MTETLSARHCERSEAIQNPSAETVWIASSHQRKIATQFCRGLLAMTEREFNAVAPTHAHQN
jgi:hypothetical protein